MLVNASQHPGPALWQGIMLIVVAIWCVYLFTGDEEKKKPGLSLAIVGAIGMALFIGIAIAS
jgi:multisubunit Na+/H+ antiporter MnhB subunit